MFSSFKFPTLRPKTKTSSNRKKIDLTCNSKIPVGSPKDKSNRRSRFFKRGNSDICSTASISSLRSDSTALTNDLNSHEIIRTPSTDVSNFLDNIDENGLFEIGPSFFESVPTEFYQPSNVITKVMEVVIKKVDGSIGITLKGGLIPDFPQMKRPLVITHIRPNGPAARSGVIRVGDRLLKVDNNSLTNKTLLEAQQLLQDYPKSNNKYKLSLTTLTIEYDVSNMDSVKYATGPLLVEINRQNTEEFGLTLTNCSNNLSNDIILPGFYVSHIIPGSTADRCGVLNVGDKILAIDNLELEDYEGSVSEIARLLKNSKKLQILPYHIIQNKSFGYDIKQTISCIDGFNTINSKYFHQRKMCNNRHSIVQKTRDSESDYTSSRYQNNMDVSHSEIMTVVLNNDVNGFGLTVAIAEKNDNKNTSSIVITAIAINSPAYRCGCLQVGDRVLSINNQFDLPESDIISLIQNKDEYHSIAKLTMEVEFDVAESVVPSSGIFIVKLPKKCPCLGITITASKTLPEDPFIISNIKKGSVAYRIGSLHAGDRILEIDNCPLTQYMVDSTFHLFQNSKMDIVTLKVEKLETQENHQFSESIVYTVELNKHGGSLGITISGSEDCNKPIILSKLAKGGLAAKTGVLQAGDKILAINGESLEHSTLTDAIKLLQNSGDRVELKVTRSLKNEDVTNKYSRDSSSTLHSNIITNCWEEKSEYLSPDGIRSVDSAVHSWDSTNDDNIERYTDMKDVESITNDPLSVPRECSTLTAKNKHDSQVQFYSDVDETECPSPLPIPAYNFTNSASSTFQARNYYGPPDFEADQDASLIGNDIFQVTLYKDSVYDDYGFSVSDGLYEKGVYVNKIRKDGPADMVGLLKPYDRIIQVNNTKTQDFDCCLTVPLIASAGDRIDLIVARNSYLNSSKEDLYDFRSTTVNIQDNCSTITKKL